MVGQNLLNITKLLNWVAEREGECHLFCQIPRKTIKTQQR